jgi:tetratricopeptide (TPR) repeat protein
MKIGALIALFLLCFAMPPVYAQHDLSACADPKEHFSKGHEFYKQGKYDDAIAEFKKSLEHDPKDAASLFGLGNSYFLKQNFSEAIKCYQEVTKLKPDFAKAHYALALAYRRIGKADESEKEFDLYNRLSAQKPPEKPAAAPKPPEKPVVKRVEAEKARPTEGAARPEVVRPEKRGLPEEVLKKARPAEGKAEKPAVKVVQRPPEEGGGFLSRWISGLWSGSPLGRLFVALIAYTLVTQVWIAVVVLVGLIVLWRRH